jgi:succinoglycan biosynthesis transport protein ExoP
VEAIPKIDPDPPLPGLAAGRAPEFIDYLAVLWRWRATLVAGTLAAAATALIVSLIVPKTYQATTTLMVTRSKFGSEQMLGPQQLALAAKTFEGIIRNRGAAAEAVEKFNLAAAPHALKPRDLLDRIDSSAVKDTSLLTVSVELRDPQMAADVANFLAARAINLNNTLNEGEMGESRAFLEPQVVQAATDLKAAETALEEYQKQANIEIARKELESRLARFGELEAQRTKVEADLAATGGALASLEQSLAEQPTVLTTARSLVADPAYQQALAKLGRADANALLALTMQSQEVNPVHTFVEQKMAEARREAGSLRARKAQIAQLMAENNERLDSVQTALTEKTMQTQRLVRAYEMQRDAYKSLRSRLDAANVEVASKTSLLKVVDPAIAPQRALRPRKGLNTAIGAVAGLVCMLTVAFLSEYVERTHRDRRGTMPPSPL